MTGPWSTLEHDQACHGAQRFLAIVSWVIPGSVTAAGLRLIGPQLKQFLGIFERLFHLSSLASFFVVPIDLARISN
jgi:hypothetical protein